MSEDESADIGERLEACQAANDCRLSIVQILNEYSDFVSHRKVAKTSTFENSINEEEWRANGEKVRNEG